MTIRVVLADDQALLRAGFRVLIDAAEDLEVVGEASDGAEVVAVALETVPDVILMDVRMPGTDGLAATRTIVADDRLRDVRIIVLTTFEVDEYVVEAVRAGASGFLGKGVKPDVLLDAIRVVAAGETLLSPKATTALIARFTAQDPRVPSASDSENAVDLDVLTPREREVVALAATGLTNEQIGEQLYLSPLTAKTHVNRAMTKLGARGRAQLVVIAYESGLVRPGGQ
jgi:DNA-binding NarL/FixJ family response regulator